MNHSETGDNGRFRRRDVVKLVGASAVGTVAASGTASAHTITEAVFCGCSQVCACGDGKISVIVAHETSDGFSCETIPIDEDPNSDFSFCYEESDGKVIAIEDGDGTVVCNPHDPCAEDAINACIENDCFEKCHRYGQRGGPCGQAFLRNCGDGGDGGPGRSGGNSGGRRHRD